MQQSIIDMIMRNKMALIKYLLFFFYTIINEISKLRYSLILRLLLSERQCGCEQPGPSENQAKLNMDKWTIGKSTKSQNNNH